MSNRVCVVIPSYCVRDHILDVLARIGPEVDSIFVVDDACPQASGQWVTDHCQDPRVRVLSRPVNGGVGAAVMTGYQAALLAGASVVVKLDGDGQMDPALIGHFVTPILRGHADYTKGNRFYDLRQIGQMPKVRIVGNAVLSLASKLSTGYWHLFDTTNGYTAIHARVLARLPLERISARYFFETDMLFRLNTLRAVVVDVPMDAHYGEEKSQLVIRNILGEFVWKHAKNLFKRIVYNYFLRDMTVASLELLAGCALFGFGVVFGLVHWLAAAGSGLPTPTGTVMLAALPTLMGLQLLLAFVAFDVANVPKRPLHLDLHDRHP